MQAERRGWKAEQKVGAAERRKFHNEAKKRVIKRLMRPTPLDGILAAVSSFFASKSRKARGKGASGPQGVDDADIEKGVHSGEDDAEEESGMGDDSDAEDEGGGGGGGKSKGKGAASGRVTSSRGSKGERGLSEAETEADRPEPPDSDDD